MPLRARPNELTKLPNYLVPNSILGTLATPHPIRYYRGEIVYSENGVVSKKPGQLRCDLAIELGGISKSHSSAPRNASEIRGKLGQSRNPPSPTHTPPPGNFGRAQLQPLSVQVQPLSNRRNPRSINGRSAWGEGVCDLIHRG